MKIRCPRCGAELEVRDALRGKTARCPQCSEKLLLEPEISEKDEFLALDITEEATGAVDEEFKGSRQSSEDFGGIKHRPLSGLRPKKKKAGSPSDAADEHAARPKRRRRAPRSTAGMLAGIVSARFWRSTLIHLPYISGALLCVGALLGFLIGLAQSAVVAGLLFDLIGTPTAFAVFFLMSYPTSCFWKVVVGSSESNADINEWPESSVGEFVFDMLFVGYMILISMMLAIGIAKLREVAIPGQLPSEEYWQLVAKEAETNTIGPLKLLANDKPKDAAEATSPRPLLQPGPAWITTFAAFVLIFPLVVMSCLDAGTPLLVPWSPRILLSLLKNCLSWLVFLVLSGAVLIAAAVILIAGTTYAPFSTFTLCSPLAAFGLVLYGRLIGQLSWAIGNA